MKTPQLREFRPFSTQKEELVSETAKYLSVDLVRTLKDLMVTLRNLSFGDNFDSFTETVTIDAGQELAIRNKLPSGLIPTSRIILRGGEGAESIVDGTTAWDQNYVYLKNVGASQVEVKVAFLR